MRPLRRLRSPWPALVVASAVLCACGGGGGGDPSPTPPPGDIDLSAANRDAVVRSASVALLGGLIVEASGLTGSSGPVASARASALRSLRRLPAGPIDLSGPCDVSGSVTATLDDRDNSLSVTPGDVLTADFVACRDAGTGQVVDGRMVATYTQAISAPLTVGANVVLTGFRSVSGPSSRSTTYQGDFALSYVEQNASTSTTQITVGQTLAAQLVHPLYQDTVTFQPGYRVSLYYDLATPPGAGSGGRTIIEALGRVASVAAGGVFQVWSQPPGLDFWDVEPYPRSGQVALQGRNGLIVLNVLSASTVRIELDANGDAVPETTQDVAWDWLV